MKWDWSVLKLQGFQLRLALGLDTCWCHGGEHRLLSGETGGFVRPQSSSVQPVTCIHFPRLWLCQKFVQSNRPFVQNQSLACLWPSCQYQPSFTCHPHLCYQAFVAAVILVHFAGNFGAFTEVGWVGLAAPWSVCVCVSMGYDKTIYV